MTVGPASSSRAHALASAAARQDFGGLCAGLTEPLLNQSVETAASRWPAFAGAAAAAGIGVVSALPLQRRERRLGTIVVLRAGAVRLTDAELSIAQIIARVAAVAIAQQREVGETARTAVQLQHALDTRVIIEQAKGATAARLGITPEAAFGLLRAHARRESRPLADIAGQTVSGELSAHALLAPRRPGSRKLAKPVRQS